MSTNPVYHFVTSVEKQDGNEISSQKNNQKSIGDGHKVNLFKFTDEEHGWSMNTTKENGVDQI